MRSCSVGKEVDHREGDRHEQSSTNVHEDHNQEPQHHAVDEQAHGEADAEGKEQHARHEQAHRDQRLNEGGAIDLRSRGRHKRTRRHRQLVAWPVAEL